MHEFEDEDLRVPRVWWEPREKEPQGTRKNLDFGFPWGWGADVGTLQKTC